MSKDNDNDNDNKIDLALKILQEIAETPKPDLLLKDTTVAKMLDISRDQVWKLTKDGIIPKPTNIKRPDQARGCTRWKQSDINRYINSLETA